MQALLPQLPHFSIEFCILSLQFLTLPESRLALPILLFEFRLGQTVPAADEVIFFQSLDVLTLAGQLELHCFDMPFQVARVFLVPVTLLPQPHYLIAEGIEHLLKVTATATSALQPPHQAIDVLVHVAREFYDLTVASPDAAWLLIHFVGGQLVQLGAGSRRSRVVLE